MSDSLFLLICYLYSIIVCVIISIIVCVIIHAFDSNRIPKNRLDFLKMVFLPYVLWCYITRRRYLLKD